MRERKMRSWGWSGPKGDQSGVAASDFLSEAAAAEQQQQLARQGIGSVRERWLR